MSVLLTVLLWLGSLIALAYHRIPLVASTCVIGAGLILTTFFSPFSWLTLLLLWGLFIPIALLLNHPDYKRKYITEPAFEFMSKSLPSMSETERVAIQAGTVGWEGELFSGRPQWEKLMTIPCAKLNEEEMAFLNKQVKNVCEMTNDWQVTNELHDLPENVWQYLKKEGFFGLVIPKKYGGKGFSEFAHSQILCTLASRSLTLSSTVAVPNSLGPAELLLRYGTPTQREYFLPRLANGEEIPCFGLTAPEAGSDAGAIRDNGIVTKGLYEGKEVIGIRLNWNKRYITLAPVATIIGLAFKLYDPQGLLGDKKDLGITCALIPVHTPGVSIGHRHMPSSIPFQNGPTQGKDVFIPIDSIIGGQEMAGHGWRMLVECLSTGRAISLPSTSVGGAKIASLTTGAYSLIRRQFRTSISAFEGVQEVLTRIAGYTYISDATRHLTVSMIDAGEKPSVPGAISKYHVTEFGRKIVNDAMDIHGGKGIMMGPNNYLARAYQGVPIAITVEGANILTRSMIIFGQGAIRCHPYLLKEMEALQHQNFNDFEHFFDQHISHTLSNSARALFYGLTRAKLASSPVSHSLKKYFQQLARASSAFALVSDATMALLGGKLKFKEALSARLGDMLSMMYLISSVLKHYQDQGAHPQDLPLARWSLDYCLNQYWKVMDELLRNLPHPSLAFGLRLLTMPLGMPRFSPKDQLNREITHLLTTENESRKRLVENVFISSNKKDSVALIEETFQEVVRLAPLLKRVYDAIKNDELAQGSLLKGIELALNAKVLTEQEATELRAIDKLCEAVVAVDDFSSDLMPHKQKTTKSKNGDNDGDNHFTSLENSGPQYLN